MNSLSRRRFLKITGAGAGVAAAAGTFGSLPGLRAAKSPVEKGIRTVPTFCDLCFWKCNAIATVKDGVLWKIEGNPDDPLSRGRLCPRGTGGVGAHFDADRLRVPLLRASVRGEEKWTEVTWDEALGHVAEKMLKIKAEYGPEAVALFSHGLGGTFLKHTVRAFGSPNSAAPSFAQCRGPRDVGFELTFGEAIGSPERTDIENARCLVLIGSHLGENMHNTQVQEFADAIGSGATIIVADPRFSIAASKAKHYLPIKPGTDLALLLAWMNVLVGEGLYDKDYVAAHGFGFEAFAAEVLPFTPEWAYPETGIEPDVIRETAREMARHRPATLVHPGRHATWYGDDAQRGRAVALLNALLGSWGRKGGFYQPASMNVPAYPYPPYPKPEKGKVDNPTTAIPFASEAITTGIREATITGQALPGEGMADLRDEPDPGPAERGRDDPGHPGSRPARGRGRRGQRDGGLGRRRAAGVDVPRAVRGAERRALPRAVRGAAPAGRRADRRPEAELVDRPRAGGEARPRGLLPLEDDRGVPRPPAEGRGPRPRAAAEAGPGARAAAADLLRGGRRRRSSRPPRRRSSSTRSS